MTRRSTHPPTGKPAPSPARRFLRGLYVGLKAAQFQAHTPFLKLNMKLAGATDWGGGTKGVLCLLPACLSVCLGLSCSCSCSCCSCHLRILTSIHT